MLLLWGGTGTGSGGGGGSTSGISRGRLVNSMNEPLKQSTARNVMVFMTDASDHVTGKASLTLTITASKDGAAFSSITPTVIDRGDGWYNLALTSSHTDTLGDLAVHITGTGADPADWKARVEVERTGAVASIGSGVIAAATFAANALDAVWSTATRALTDKASFTLTSGERTSIADAFLDRDMSTGTDSGSTTVRTPRQALRFLRNKSSIAGGTLSVKKENDSTDSWTAAVTTTAGDPISAIDPAGP